MITEILFALVLVLTGVLGFVLYVQRRVVQKRIADKNEKKEREWSTVFERTDLRKA